MLLRLTSRQGAICQFIDTPNRAKTVKNQANTVCYNGIIQDSCVLVAGYIEMTQTFGKRNISSPGPERGLESAPEPAQRAGAGEELTFDLFDAAAVLLAVVIIAGGGFYAWQNRQDISSSVRSLLASKPHAKQKPRNQFHFSKESYGNYSMARLAFIITRLAVSRYKHMALEDPEKLRKKGREAMWNSANFRVLRPATETLELAVRCHDTGIAEVAGKVIQLATGVSSMKMRWNVGEMKRAVAKSRPPSETECREKLPQLLDETLTITYDGNILHPG